MTLTFILCGLLAIGCRGLAGDHKQNFFSYDRKAVSAFLKKHGLQGSPDWIQRNNTGDKLYVHVYDKADPGNRQVVVVTKDGLSKKVVPEIRAFFNENEEVVAWFADVKQGITFKNQFILHLPRFALFDVDPAGKYFVIGEKPNKTWVGSVEQPDLPIVVATNFLGSSIFSTERGLIVVGSVKRNGGYTSGAMLIEHNREKRFVVEKTFDFSSFGGVVDVSAEGNCFVLQGKSDLFAGWYLHNASSGKTKRLGLATEFGFFLNMDLLATAAAKEKSATFKGK